MMYAKKLISEIRKFCHLDYVTQSHNEYYTCFGKELLNYFLCLAERQKEVTRRSQIGLCKKSSTGKNLTALTGAQLKKEK